MTIDIGKARWAARRAESLERQVQELTAVPGDANWRARSRRHATQDQLRAEAARFRRLAARYRGAVA